jgi:proline iminopeptidase
MKKSTKNILFITSAILIILFVIAWWLWYQMSQPMYKPGTMNNNPVAMVQQKGDTAFWNMPGDINLFHFSEGQGTKILTLHGGPGIPWENSAKGFSLLADQFHLFYYDQRGCGRSTRPFDRFPPANYYKNMTALESNLGIKAQLADIERIRQILGEEKIILIGHSFGAFLAALYAAEYPEKVKALVLVAPANILKLPSEEEDLFQKIRKNLPNSMQPEFDAWQKTYFDFGEIFQKSENDLQIISLQFLKYYQEAAKNQGKTLPDMGPSTVRPGGWMTYATYFSMGKKHDYRAAMKAVKAPVLVLHGTNDLQSETASKTFAAAFPDAQFKTIEGSGHFPFFEQPEAFSAIVRQFLNNNK